MDALFLLETLKRFLMLFTSLVFRLLWFALIIHILMSWVAVGRTKIGIIIDQIVRPMLRPFNWIQIGGIGLGPIVVLFLLTFAEDTLLRLIALIPA